MNLMVARASRYALLICSILAAAAAPAIAAEAVVHSFGATQSDGASPLGGLISVQGALYGTTSSGGGPNEGGTVFRLTPAGGETILYSFPSFANGAPSAGLTYLLGNLYGTTIGFDPEHDRADADGSVFSFALQGGEASLHYFSGSTSDGAVPLGALVNAGGTLYGTTQYGGGACTASAAGCGTIFSITLGGTEQVLYSFKHGADGAYPNAGLLNVGGTLYGTASEGGQYGCGVVFKITKAGAETPVHAFNCVGTDGTYPTAGLIRVGNTLYGTTKYGGAYGGGTVFSITPSGVEKILYAFKRDGADGNFPEAPMLYENGLLYGTTSLGGSFNTAAGGNGTVFSITPTGSEKILHSFAGGQADGAYPSSGLTFLGGLLYGTTVNGGAYDQGTVFRIGIPK